MHLKAVGYTDAVLFLTIGNAVNVQSPVIGKPDMYRRKYQVSRQPIVFIFVVILRISKIRAYPLFPTSLLIMHCSLRLLDCQKKMDYRITYSYLSVFSIFPLAGSLFLSGVPILQIFNLVFLLGNVHCLYLLLLLAVSYEV